MVIKTLNRRFRLRLLPPTVASALAVALFAGPLLTGALDAQPPSSPPPPLKVVQQNLDTNGFIKVHEQGIAEVAGTVAVSRGSVAVTNLPSALNVHHAPVVGALTYAFLIAQPSVRVESFPTINATAIHINTPDNISARFESPLSGLTLGGVPHQFLWFTGTNGELQNFVRTFNQPVPLSGVRLHCLNDFDNCFVFLSILGTSQ